MFSRVYAAWLEKIELKTAIKMGITAMLSLYIGLHFTNLIERPDPLASALWCVIASIVVLQTNIGGTYQAIFNRLIGVFIGSVTGALFASLLGLEAISLGFAIVVTIILCSMGHLTDSYRIAALSVAAVMIPWNLHPLISPWVFAFFRFIDTFMGVMIAMAVVHSIWPSEATTKMRRNLSTILSLIEQLYHDTLVFHGHLQQERQKRGETDLVSEVNGLLMQTRLMLNEAKLEVLLQSSTIPLWNEILDSLEQIFRAIYALQSVFNKTVESIFDEDLSAQVVDLMLSIDAVLKELKPKLEAEVLIQTIPQMKESEALLNVQLIRFRSTYTTRRFNLEDVEKYFVFLFNLKWLVKELIHLNHLLSLVYSEPD